MVRVEEEKTLPPRSKASEVAPNNEPSSEADPPTTESDKPSEVIR